MSEELTNYRNLAENVWDQHGNVNCYPHASANVETRGESVFAALNAIDGITVSESHGQWPYESWGVNRREDATWKLEFGRPIEMDKLILYTRADFPHDNWWEQATVTFSDGSIEVLELKKGGEAQIFNIHKENIEWLELSHLIKADDPSPFPALTQLQVYAAAKGGLKMLTKNIASEYGEYNIQCNGIGPGYIATPQTAPLREIQPDGERHPFDKFIIAKTPAARWGTPEDLEGPAVFLASDASDFVNGHILYVDGGILAYIGKQP